MSKFCKSCGSANTDNAIQCSRCGKPLANGGGHTAKASYGQNMNLSNGGTGNTYRRPNYSVPPQQGRNSQSYSVPPQQGRSSQTYSASPKQGRASQTYSTPLQQTNSNVSSTTNKGNSGKMVFLVSLELLHLLP